MVSGGSRFLAPARSVGLQGDPPSATHSAAVAGSRSLPANTRPAIAAAPGVSGPGDRAVRRVLPLGRELQPVPRGWEQGGTAAVGRLVVLTWRSLLGQGPGVRAERPAGLRGSKRGSFHVAPAAGTNLPV